jgi:hypothetical protein
MRKQNNKPIITFELIPVYNHETNTIQLKITNIERKIKQWTD